ncbi:MAG: sugar phosphate isomerase/epimerase [Lentisphaeraceae bacterium]|nr:sugar phosphate isomerase/epimerase [Lentisphaeraceae bacterium]
MKDIKIGCEHYAWVMAGCIEPQEPFYDKIDHIANVVGKAGFQGFEPIDKFLYSFYDSERLADSMKNAGIELSSVVLLDDWLNPKETDAEKEASDKLIDFLSKYFPEAVVMLCQMPTTRDENHLAERHDNLISCINKISKRAAGKGLTCSYHPNSPETSIWRDASDYEKLLPRLDSKVLGWTPDVGHMALRDMDPIKLMRDYRSIINHVHYKDMHADKSWALMGEGVIDFKTITKDLVDTDFKGWIIVEDECERSVNEPDAVTVECGTYSKDVIEPIIQKVTV